MGSSEQITFYIVFVGKSNSEGSDFIQINDLVKVEFVFIQNNIELDGRCMEARYIVRKLVKDCTVKIKVTADTFTKYSVEKICSDKPSWEIIDDTICCEVALSEHYRNDYPDNAYAFQFVVTIDAFKVDATIYRKVYDDAEFTDFHLTTADSAGSVAVHKAYLAAVSDVFQAMLRREWKETKEGCINMKGLSLQTLQHLKDYMYLGTLPEDGLLPLLSIASCYLIEDLKTQCISKMTENINPENLYRLLKYSIEHEVPELTFAIMKATPGSVIGNAEKAMFKKRLDQEVKEE